MSETNISIYSLIPNGKISTRPGEITGQYVTAVSRIYMNRSDGDQEYMIEETGIVERTAYDSLAICYIEASKMAYQNALSRLMNNEAPQYETKQGEMKATVVVTDKSPVSEQPSTRNPENRASAPESEPVKESHYEQKDEGEPLLFSESSGGQQEPTVKKLDLNLIPAASLMGTNAENTGNDEDDPIQKARDIQITIIGQAHECYNWSAGRILDEVPEIIVKFAHRYSGEKKVEKEALLTLYPEAVRRYEKAS